MRGHVFKRGSTWSFIHDVGRRADGRRQQSLKGGFATRREAQAALSESLAQNAKGGVQDPGRLTLREYLLDQWLPTLHDLRPNTRLSYETLTRLHLLPHLGGRQLRRLTRSDCDSLYVRLQKPDPVTGRTLSAATIRRVHAILHAALSAAVQRGLLGHNVSDHVRLPRAPKPRLATWTPEQLQRFLESTQSDRLGPLYLLLATTGLRRGEAVGLPWSAVNLDAGLLAVRQSMVSVAYEVQLGEPKTTYGERTVALDDITLEVLRAVRHQQQGEAHVLGRGWVDTGLVFTRPDGTAWHPETVSKRFVQLARGAGLPPIRLHDLRHTHASLGLFGGVHLKVMQESLGHSSISVTANMYSHVTPGLQRDAAQLVATLGEWRPALAKCEQLGPRDDSADPPEGENPQVSVCAPEGTRTPNLLIRREPPAVPGGADE